MRTADYSERGRLRLGEAVREAREALGFKFRPPFAKFAGIAPRSLADLETGKPTVGEANLKAVARALPNWTEDTPVAILNGADAPPTAKPSEPLRAQPADEAPPYDWSTESRQRLIAMSMREVRQLVEHVELVLDEAAAERALRAILRLRKEAASIGEASEVDAP